MTTSGYAFLINSVCLIGWLMAILPAIMFLRRAWAARRDALFQLMTQDVLELYYKRFYPSRVIAPAERQAVFQKDFGAKYGRRWYVIPLLLLGAISGLGLWGTAGTLKVWCGVDPSAASFGIQDIALGAFLGGITWVIADQLTRLRNRDFTSHDVYNAVFRILLSVPLGYSLATFGDAKLKVAIGFLLGAFPTSTLFTIARRLGAKQLGMGDDAVAGSNASELEKLQSIGKAAAERFRDEGVSSIAALAWTDPVDLTIRTNMEFGYVVDCISQALLWIYVRDDVQQLYVLSLRGAQEVCSFRKDLQSSDTTVQSEAQETLKEAAARLKVSPAALHQTVLQVADDPSTKFLVKVWASQCDVKN